MISQVENTKRKYFRQGFSAFVASLSYFAGGEVRSWSSSGVPSLQGQDGFNATLSQGPLPIETASWITSSPPIGAMIGALVAGALLQKFGRKMTLLVSIITAFVSFIMLATSSLHEIPAVMIIARVLQGMSVGFSMAAATIYIAECTDPKIRGLLGSLPAVLMAFGISYTYFCGAFLPWHHLAYICSIIPLLNSIAIFFTPESPIWLKMNGKFLESNEASEWLNGEKLPIAIEQLKEVQNVSPVKEETLHETVAGLSIISELKNKTVWHPFLLVLASMFFQQWCGINGVIFNTVTIFSAANVNISKHLATNIVGVVQLIATILSIFVVDKAGRKVLLLISGVVMALPLASIGAFFYVFSDPETSNQEWRSNLEWVPLVSLIIYMIGYSIGFACVPFILLGEMLPGRMRNFLGAIVSSFNLLMILLVLKFFPNLHMAIGFHGLFWIYAAVSLFGGIFSFIFIPETKGKTLNEIESFFSKKHFLTSEDLS